MAGTGKKQAGSKEKPGTIEFSFKGIDVAVPDRIADDWEFVEMAADMANADPARVVSLVKAFAGDSYDAVKEAVRRECGYVSAVAMGEFVLAGMNAVKEHSPNS